jgi:hypothetical protein
MKIPDVAVTACSTWPPPDGHAPRSFREFGEPPWDRVRYFLPFGVQQTAHGTPEAGRGQVRAYQPIENRYSAIAEATGVYEKRMD